jgi:imidazoleglycerol-phosphate dehydratase/histidinol-phosphatase
MKQRILFIDRDGTILREPADEQIDSFEKFSFVPGAISALRFLRQHTDFLFVMVSNQDGLGTDSYPEEDFWPTQNLMLDVLKGEGICFDAIHIDRSFPEDNLPTRKPGTAMLTDYMTEDYDISGSFVIGDRKTDAQLAENLGCGSYILSPDMTWEKISELLFAGYRTASVRRTTKETDIEVRVCLDGDGKSDIQTGLGFFDHMLNSFATHGGFGLTVKAVGDLKVDGHHTVEDTGIVLGQAIRQAIGDKKGIRRYGSFILPMDETLVLASLDLSGRPYLGFEAEFHTERVGQFDTEMVREFFYAVTYSCGMNLHLREIAGSNSHHIIEGCFKSVARSLHAAVAIDEAFKNEIPSTKGVL